MPHYLQEQWPYLEDASSGVFQQPRGAQHYAFCDGQDELALLQYPPAGVQSSAVIYNLIETAKENNLDLYHYLIWHLHNAPERS